MIGLVIGLTISGCAGSGAVTATASIAGETQAARRAGTSGGFIYVTDQLFGTPYVGAIDYFPVGSNGDVQPSGSITGSNTQLTQTVGIVVDGAGQKSLPRTPTRIPSSASRQVRAEMSLPTSVIEGAATGLAFATRAGALDSAGNLYVANCGTECNYGPPGPTSVEEFAPGSNGNIAPMRTISGGRTQLGQADGIAVDDKGDIYVGTAKQQAVTVYGPRAHGDSRPIRVLSGENTHINGPGRRRR